MGYATDTTGARERVSQTFSDVLDDWVPRRIQVDSKYPDVGSGTITLRTAMFVALLREYGPIQAPCPVWDEDDNTRHGSD
jgi:hypothetical protein